MPTCKNCGKSISEQQSDAYMGFCDDCLQNQLHNTVREEAVNRGIHLCQMDSCESVAIAQCQKCGKNICARHAMTNKTATVIKCQTCGERQNTGRIVWRVLRIILAVVVLVLVIVRL